MKYRTIDHTADLGLEIFGSDLSALFENACWALFDTIAEPSLIAGKNKQALSVSGIDLPDLLVNWLRELLALWTVEEKLVGTVEVVSVSETEVSARLRYDVFNSDKHRLKREVKAVTYHQVRVVEVSEGWEARVVLDV